MSTFENQPWHALPPETASVILPEIPALRDEIIHAISQEVPAYARPLEGAFGRGIERGVEEALREFASLLVDPQRGRAQSREVYRALGRGEMRAGRSLDVLQAAYRIGARATWRRLAEAGLRAGLQAPVLCSLADSIFAYIDELAADSVDGFADAQRQAAGERDRRRQELLILLLAEPHDHEAVREAALNSQWRLPQALAALACHSDDLDAITRRLPHDALAGAIDDRGCVLVPDAAAPGRARVIAAACAGRAASLGPTCPPAAVVSSWRRARSALEAMQLGALPARFCRAEEHLAAIAMVLAREPLRELAGLRLAPLQQLTPNSRARMTATLRAYLEQRGNTAAMADVLDLHPQTVRYRMRQLHGLFGEALDDADARFELEAAVRLPLRTVSEGVTGTGTSRAVRTPLRRVIDTVSSMPSVCVARTGAGPEVLLVHGGASPGTTWNGLQSLEARWTLAQVYRRGYPPSPSPAGTQQDFLVDAGDIAPLLASRPHVVAHSYGVLGTLIAASRAPSNVRSLTLIEPPLYRLVPDDAEVGHLEQIGDAVLTDGLDADAAMLREFLRLAGAKGVDEGPLPEEVAQGGPSCARRAPTRRGSTGAVRHSRSRSPCARGLGRPLDRAGADLRCPGRRAARRASARARSRALRGCGAGLRPAARRVPRVA